MCAVCDITFLGVINIFLKHRNFHIEIFVSTTARTLLADVQRAHNPRRIILAGPDAGEILGHLFTQREEKSDKTSVSIEVLSDQDSSLALKIITPDDFQGQQNKLKNKWSVPLQARLL